MQEQRFALLAELLCKKVNRAERIRTVKSELQEVTKPKISGLYKIPESDKPFSIFFIDPSPPIVVHEKPVYYKETIVWLSAFFSKHPHLKYLQSTKVQGCERNYWFKDTAAIVVICTKEYPDRSDISFVKGKTIVYSEEEVERKLK